jgi:hypothetical protein
MICIQHTHAHGVSWSLVLLGQHLPADLPPGDERHRLQRDVRHQLRLHAREDQIALQRLARERRQPVAHERQRRQRLAESGFELSGLVPGTGQRQKHLHAWPFLREERCLGCGGVLSTRIYTSHRGTALITYLVAQDQHTGRERATLEGAFQRLAAGPLVRRLLRARQRLE